MKSRTIILLLSVFLFGMAFGCNPLSNDAEDYMLAIQHTTEHDILIVDTELDDKGGTLEGCTAELMLDGVNKSFNSSDGDMECEIVSNSKRGWFAIKLDKGALPAASGALKVKIDYSFEVEGESTDSASDETPMLNITKAKSYSIKMASVVLDNREHDYSFVLSLPSSVSNAKINYALNADGLRNMSIPIPGGSCTANECTYPLSTYGAGVYSRLVQAVSKSGSGDDEVITPITPLLYAIGCIQTPEVVGKDGAGLCLPAESDGSPDCEADPSAEGCENPPDCEADPSAEGCEENTVDPDDLDGDLVKNEDDQCPDQAETYTFSSLRPADGVLDGCPNSEGDDGKTIDPNLDEGGDELPGMSNDGSGCSLNPAAAANSGGLFLMLAALSYMVIRKKR